MPRAGFSDPALSRSQCTSAVWSAPLTLGLLVILLLPVRILRAIRRFAVRTRCVPGVAVTPSG